MKEKTNGIAARDEKQSEPIGSVEEAATGTVTQPDVDVELSRLGLLQPLLRPAFWVMCVGLLAALYVNYFVSPTWREQKSTYQVYQNDSGDLAYKYKGEEQLVGKYVRYEQSVLNQAALNAVKTKPALEQQWVVEEIIEEGRSGQRYSLLEAKFHFGLASLLPAIVAIALCLLTREPLTALFSGIVVGAFMLDRFDITDQVLVPSLATTSAASVLFVSLVARRSDGHMVAYRCGAGVCRVYD